MKARNRIQQASYSPEQVKVLGKVFDDAWTQIAPTISNRPNAVESTRLKLATAVLSAAKDLPNGSADEIKEEALRTLHAPPTEL
jgi:hypothetical protein